MKRLLFLVLLIGCTLGVFAQNHIQHTVVKDDTVTSLARKYSVTAYDIYQLNPEAKNGIKLGEIIIIPKLQKDAKKATGKATYHKVEPKETMFGIAQKYGVTIQAIQEANTKLLENGLQPGLELRIPLDVKAESTTTVLQDDRIIHVVLPKETSFALRQKYGISEEELLAENPQIKDGLKIGDTLRIPLRQETESLEIAQSDNLFLSKASFKELNKSIHNTELQEVAILIPFNANMIGSNSEDIQKSFRTNKLLNIAVDFYSGALMAVEDIKALGGNFNITFYDSEETQSHSAVESLINSGKLSGVDALIGPFFQTHNERAAQLLKNKKTLVISPISKEGVAKYENLYLSVPPSDISKKMMLNYLKNKNENSIAIVDRKKQSSRTFIAQNYSGISFVSFTEEGRLNTENLKSLLKKDRVNYVILETESSSMIMNVTRILTGLKDDYNIKLVALDRNAAFESDEVRSQTLADLYFHYPSHLRDITENDNNVFYSRYKALNETAPSYAAIRGYDVVYDVLLRLAQKEDFDKTAKKIATEQVDSKFIYTKSAEGGYYNTGVYIMYYDTDLTIKEAK